MLKLSALVPLITLAIAPDASRLIPRHKAHPWSAWRPGACVEFDSEQKVDGRTVDRWTTRQTLMAATRDTAEVREVIPQWRADLLRTCALRADQEADLRIDRDETVTIAGRRVACRRLSQPGGRFWIARDAGPVHLVKSERSARGVTHRESVAAWDEPLTACGRTIRCVRFEETSEAQLSHHVTTTWLSTAIPGGIARCRCTQTGSDGLTLVGEAVAVRWT
jgi:hypothetical protein